MKYEDCLLYCLKEIAAEDQDDLHGLRLLLNLPTPSPDEWAEVLEKAALIGDDPSPWDLLGEYEMRLRSRGIQTLLERESKRVLAELRQVGRDMNVPDHFVDDCAKLALLGASTRSSSRH
jgi:hypothetical protein